MKTFPYEYESTKEVSFYPEEPQNFSADILEIGPGRGDFLIEWAKNFPDKKITAVEIGRKRFHRLIPRLEKNSINNVLLVRGDIRLVLPRFFRQNTFEKIFVLYPDPWPKKRHAFRRLLTVEMLWLICHHLDPGGELIFATDVESYARWVAENVAQIPPLKPLDPAGNTAFPLSGAAPTFFEKKWVSSGRNIHYLWWKKHDTKNFL